MPFEAPVTITRLPVIVCVIVDPFVVRVYLSVKAIEKQARARGADPLLPRRPPRLLPTDGPEKTAGAAEDAEDCSARNPGQVFNVSAFHA